MVAYIDAHRDAYGIEPICAVLPIAPSTYWRHKAQQVNPTRRSARAQRDDALKREITRVWHEHEQVYGAEKVWRQLRREQIPAARCTVERLMKALALRGVVRGGRFVVTTRPNDAVVMPDLVDRQFTATPPEPTLGVGLHLRGDRRRICLHGVRASMSSRAGSSAGRSRTRCAPTSSSTRSSRRSITRGDEMTGLVHHSDRGVQYVSMRYTERLADAGIAPSVGSRGDAYDNALAESVIGSIQDGGDWTA